MLAARDSETMKTITVLTLLFLPSSLVTVRFFSLRLTNAGLLKLSTLDSAQMLMIYVYSVDLVGRSF